MSERKPFPSAPSFSIVVAILSDMAESPAERRICGRSETRLWLSRGASSGIGRATAHALASRGAITVLVARREAALEDVVDEIGSYGRRALAVPADVTDPEAMEVIATEVAQFFGRVDVWINNAAVTLFGKFEDAPLEDVHRVIETNLFGYINGALAVLPLFKEQGRGSLFNISSGVGKTGQPYTSAYVISSSG